MASKKNSPVRLLITGFEPFGGSTLNPSQALVEAIRSMGPIADGVELCTALLPVDTRRIAAELESLWSQTEPDVVVHLGESPKAKCMVLERVAINLLDFDQPDNAGQHLVDQPIDPDGPAARFATLPVRVIQARLKNDGVEVDLSLSAGTYLCNQTLYLSLAKAKQRGGRAVGFVHVPSLPEQVQRGERDEPAMPLDQLTQQIQRLLVHTIDLYQVG